MEIAILYDLLCYLLVLYWLILAVCSFDSEAAAHLKTWAGSGASRCLILGSIGRMGDSFITRYGIGEVGLQQKNKCCKKS